MDGHREPATWQEFLGQLIASTQERARLATAIRVRPITLQRWAEGISRPRDTHIRALVKNLPSGVYTLFMHLLVIDFPELLQETLPEVHFAQKLPPEFYARALRNLALTPQPLYRQSMQDLLLQQALQHLDPDRQGLAITLAVCTLPRAGCKVRSLHEIAGLATPPWPYNVVENLLFLGAESLVGYAITHVRATVINDREELTLFPAHWTEHERSAAAFPILRHAQIAGGLIVASAQEYFFTPPRLALLEAYAHLAACLFEPADFFASEEIALRIMPVSTLQRPYFAGYTRRVLQKFAEANAKGEQQVTLPRVRQLVWQDLEDVLLHVSSPTSVEPLL